MNIFFTEAAGREEGGQQPRVGIIMGSDSDLPTMRAAAEVLRDFGIAAEVTVVSAHRTPDRMLEYARSAHSRGIKVWLFPLLIFLSLDGRTPAGQLRLLGLYRSNDLFPVPPMTACRLPQ